MRERSERWEKKGREDEREDGMGEEMGEEGCEKREETAIFRIQASR